ncbi:galactose oxidase [Dyadobacter sp. CY326]|uniref:galactose oxidase n=1 Tax=Dyadobacter sp. CY326 TaxID=2907300 RepID=UPI001F424F76|nr:galactose oxidase [Dyadobacter sp. CY326]MCE7064630.1 galactose oxidase [Dyadobacter sp. CY326]
MCECFKILSFLLAIQFFNGAGNACHAQSYGLGFESFESVQDRRTGLDLSPEKTLCFDKDFELSFELSFLPHKKNYFGYIVRLIENDRRNIDILYDNSSLNKDRFKVVIGDKFSKITFGIEEKALYQNWNMIRLVFNKSEGTLSVFSGTKRFKQTVDLDKDGCYKILFGANKYKNFNTTDVPPMKIRNVAILENGVEKFQWKLDEMSGTKAVGESKYSDGLVANPLWIKKMHYDWQSLQNFVVDGPARVTANEKAGIVWIVATDTLTMHRIATNQARKIAYQAKQSIFMDNQVLYEPSTNRIYNLAINEKEVASFDTVTGRWDKENVVPALKTHFLHANKFYSAADSTIYMLGGYGHLEYKNTIQKYQPAKGQWQQVHPRDSVFTPRYLAAAGTVNGGAYILGGYGSTTGRQILNPRNWYDLIFFDTKTGAFKKIYELKTPQEDFVCANSMIINEKEGTFYALIFPKDKFKSELQLIRGSLTKPEYEIVGSKIPYEFVDTESFADLFFDQSTGRFVAVTLFRTDKNQTKVSVYSLYAPPLGKIPNVEQATAKSPGTFWIIAALAALLGGFYFYKRRKTMVSDPHSIPVSTENTEVQEIALVTPLHAPESQEKGIETKAAPLQSSIMLFGNLQLFDEEGSEITRLFTPLLKELFLVILLHSVRREGISSEKLKELLWFDKSSDSARNNRAVNIAKLKGILDKLKWCHISKESGYWRVNIDYAHIHVDYAEYLKLVSDKRALSKLDIVALSQISKRGTFLADLEYEWLDSFKSEISNEIVDAYLRYATSVKVADEPEFMIKVANYIFYFDPVNEEAMTIKCKALALLGKHSLAKTTFENFAREYSRIYGEEFRKDMPEVLHS